MKKLITQLTESWELQEPDFPLESDYNAIVDYLIEKQQVTIRYYSYVMKIGVAGAILSLLLLLLMFIEGGCDVKQLFTIKQYPSILFSFMTIGFSQMEIEHQKKELYKKLVEVAKTVKDTDPDIHTEYKKWTWQEFQDKFKTNEL